MESTYIDLYINEGKKNTICARNLFDTYLVGDVNNPHHFYRVGFYDMFLQRINELYPTMQWYALPESLYYKPKSLSLELYGTTELWLAILRANGMKNVTEFHTPFVKVFSSEGLLEIIKVYFKREKKT